MTMSEDRPTGINWFGYWQPVAYAPCLHCELLVQYNMAIGHIAHWQAVPVDSGTDVVGCGEPWPNP